MEIANDNNSLMNRFKGRPHWLNPDKPLVSKVEKEKLWASEVFLNQFSVDEQDITKGKNLRDTFGKIINRLFNEGLVSVELDGSGTPAWSPVIITKKSKYGFVKLDPNGDVSHSLLHLHCYLLCKYDLGLGNVDFFYYQTDSFFICSGTKILIPSFNLYSYGSFNDGILCMNQLVPSSYSCGRCRYMYQRFYSEIEEGRIKQADPESYVFIDESFWIDPDDFDAIKKTKESDLEKRLSSIEEKLDSLIGLIKSYASNLVTLILICAVVSLLGSLISKFFN